MQMNAEATYNDKFIRAKSDLRNTITSQKYHASLVFTYQVVNDSHCSNKPSTPKLLGAGDSRYPSARFSRKLTDLECLEFASKGPTDWAFIRDFTFDGVPTNWANLNDSKIRILSLINSVLCTFIKTQMVLLSF